MRKDSLNDQEVENELLARVGQGDRSGFEQLYDRLAGALFCAALQVLGDQREAEDVLQDVFIQI